jgi:hypothetical protein
MWFLTAQKICICGQHVGGSKICGIHYRNMDRGKLGGKLKAHVLNRIRFINQYKNILDSFHSSKV